MVDSELAKFIADMTYHGSREIGVVGVGFISSHSLRLSSVRLVWFESGSGAGF